MTHANNNMYLYIGIAILILGITGCAYICSTERDSSEKSTEYKSILGTSIILSLIGLGLIITYFVLHKEKYKQNGDSSSLVKTLKKNGWICFTRLGCGWCDKQKQDLGTDIEIISYDINTDEGKAKLIELNITADGVPLWYNINTKESSPGYKTSEKLNEMIGVA